MHMLHKLILLTPLLATSAFAQQNGDLEEDGIFKRGSYFTLEHDPVSAWAYYHMPSTGTFQAVISANEMNEELERAELTVECFEEFHGKQISIGVNYLMQGGNYPGDQYSLDLFNSSISGRPAAFDIGAGFVRTDHISFSSVSGERPPQEYNEMISNFWADLHHLGSEQPIEIRFKDRKVVGPYARLVFPENGLKAALDAAKDYCPPAQ